MLLAAGAVHKVFYYAGLFIEFILCETRTFSWYEYIFHRGTSLPRLVCLFTSILGVFRPAHQLKRKNGVSIFMREIPGSFF